MEVDTVRLETSRTEARVLKKLSLAGIAKLSRLKYSRLRFVWPKGVGPGPTLAWPGWKQPDIPVGVDTGRLNTDVGRQEF